MPQIEGEDPLCGITLKGFLVQTRALEAVPISTIASEASFSIGRCVLDIFSSSMTASMVEALTCAQGWLRSASLPLSMM